MSSSFIFAGLSQIIMYIKNKKSLFFKKLFLLITLVCGTGQVRGAMGLFDQFLKDMFDARAVVGSMGKNRNYVYDFRHDGGNQKYSTEDIEALLNYWGIDMDTTYQNREQTLRNADGLVTLQNAQVRERLRELGDDVQDPEAILGPGQKKAIPGKAIKKSDWVAFKRDMAKIEHCIKAIDTSSDNSWCWQDPNTNTYKSKFFSYVFLEHNLTAGVLKKNNDMLDRVDRLLNTRKDLARKAKQDALAKKQERKDKLLDQAVELRLAKAKGKSAIAVAKLTAKTEKEKIVAQKEAQKARLDAAEKARVAKAKADKESAEADRIAAEEKELMKQQLANEGTAEAVKTFFKQFTDGKTVGTILAIIGGGTFLIYAAKYGLKLVFTPKPGIILYTTLPSGMWERLFGTKTMPPITVKPVYNPEVQRRFDELFDRTQKLVKLKRKSRGKKAQKAVFTNLAFTGPPGTGKTFGAKVIAYLDGQPMKYVIIPAAALGQLPTEKALRELKGIFEWITSYTERTGEPVMVIWDEFDAIAAERSEGVSEKNLQLINMILALMPKPNDPYLFHIFITNLVLDSAIQSRVGGHFEVNLPSTEIGENGEKSALERLMKTYLERTAEDWDLSIDGQFKDEEAVAALTKMMEEGKFTGRDIEQFIEIIGTKLAIDDKGKISLEIVDEAIREKKESREASQRAAEARARGGSALVSAAA